MRASRLVLILLLAVVIRRICCDDVTEEIEAAMGDLEFDAQIEDMFTHMLRHCNLAICEPLREYNDYVCEHFWLYLGTRLFLYMGPGNILMAYTLKWVGMAICFCVGWWDGPEHTPEDDDEEPETELQARIRAPRAPRQQQPAAAAAAAPSADEVETVEAAVEEGRVGNIRRLRRQSTRIGEALGLTGNSESDTE